jgi:hypothetical protein
MKKKVEAAGIITILSADMSIIMTCVVSVAPSAYLNYQYHIESQRMLEIVPAKFIRMMRYMMGQML